MHLTWRAEADQAPVVGGQRFHEWVIDAGQVWAEMYREPGTYRVRFPGLADFFLSTDGHRVEVSPAPGVSEETVRHLYLNQALPLALSRQRRLVLHGGVVDVGGRALAFIGPSRRGKSTLAASFAANGHRFLTDDGMVVDEAQGAYRVQPSHPSIRLWSDSRQAVIPADAEVAPPVDYTPKARLLAGPGLAHVGQAQPLAAVYVLGAEGVEDLVIEALSGRDALIECVRNSFMLDIDEREVLRHQMQRLLRFIDHVPFFRLDYPRRYDLLPAVRGGIVAHAAGFAA